MDFAAIERLAALMVLLIGAVTAIIKIPDALIAARAAKKKYRSTVKSHFWICWITTLVELSNTKKQSSNWSGTMKPWSTASTPPKISC